MSTEEAFVKLVGDRLRHVTPASNLPSIVTNGLLRTVTMAARAGHAPHTLALRRDDTPIADGLFSATLNHQKPLIAGRSADFLDGYTLASWAKQLDQRLFFLPSHANNAFRNSFTVETAEIELDARAMFRAFGPLIDLAPINTGSATRRPTRRGDWIYVPARLCTRFADNRRALGHASRRDRVVEVSLRADILRDRLTLLRSG